MENEEMKHVARFAGIMVAGMTCIYLFAKLMSLAAMLDGGIR